jgi:hypothetical protein
MTPQIWEAMRLGEADDRWMQEHPEALEPYRGEWVVVYRQRVIAHDRDGKKVARAAPAQDYPGSTMFYVPTREQAEGIRI